MEEQFCRVLTFFLNGKKVTVTDADPDMTLLAWLRSPAVALTGTKLGCSEGGCGACSVLISNWDMDRKKIVHRAINACLAPLCSVDGCAVITIEGLGTSKNLHPVQERLAKFHGSQCGFCTPGIVMAVYAFLREHPNATRAALEDSMDGNLCRCTGYRPILDAIKTFGSDYGDCPLEDQLKSTHIDGGDVPQQHSQQKKTKTQFVCPSSGKPCDCGKTFADEENKLEDKMLHEHEHAEVEALSEPIFPPQLKKYEPQTLRIQGKNCVWYRPVNLEELLQLKKTHGKLAKLVVGATEITLEMKMFNYGILIAPTAVPELNKLEVTDEGITVGAAVSLTYLIQVLKEQVTTRPKEQAWLFNALVEQFRWFAGHQIRNAACLGGNIQTASPISDINPILMAAGAKVTIGSAGGVRRVVSMSDDFIRGYRQTCLEPEEVIISVHLPVTRPHEYVMAYKQARRRDDDIAIASASYRTLFEQQGNEWVVKEMYMSYGGMSKQTVRAKQTEEFMKGKAWTDDTFKAALHYLELDLPLEPNAPGGMILYRKTLTTSFFYKYFLFLKQELSGAVPDSHKNILDSFHRELSHGNQYYHMNKKASQVGYPQVHVAALKQVTGEAIYTDDIPQPSNGLYGAFVWSTKARAKILGIDPSEALKMDGVRDFLSARDIPGANQVGIVAHDEEILASQFVPSVGFPVGLVVAKTLKIAQKAAKLVKVQYEDLTPVITIDQAIETKSFFQPIHTLEHGSVDKAFKECDHVLEGEMRVGGQDHFYLETHTSLAIPGEDDEMLIWSSTQNPNEAQLKAAEALNIPANRVVVKIKRMGGGFGGKESRSFTVSSAAAVAAAKLRSPVRICLERDEDMFSTGGRHPFLGRYKVGFNNDGHIVALQVDLYANGGHSLDLSIGVIDRALFHATNTYRVPNVRAVGHICKTNTPSNTAFRGFGAPQSMIICETWLDRVAKHLNMSPTVIRDKNFIKNGDITYYGQTMEDCHNIRIWKELLDISKYEERLQQVKAFNAASRWKKRGIYCVPTQYGMSFTVKHLNQANAMVHVYMDGSVSVTHAGCEMGQGLHTKMIQIAANELGVPVDKIYIADTSTDRVSRGESVSQCEHVTDQRQVANGAPTAASVSSDLNGMAVLLACRELRRTLEPLRRQLGGEATWQQIARAAWMERLPLTAHGHYATPDLHFDWQVGKGRPFNYYNHGAACSEVEVDVLTGDFQILRTDIVMDVGESINPAIDVGQIEGAFVQGLGLFTLEEVVTFPDGRMFTRGPGTYKIPGFKDIPLEFNVHLLKDVPNARAVHSSKGVGEPPLFLAASVFFAIKDAVAAARSETQRATWFPLNSPATCERIRMSSKDDFTVQFDPNEIPY